MDRKEVLCYGCSGMQFGVIIIHTNKFWEAPVMTIFALVQAFLASMILGVVIPGLNVKIGSSPFILLERCDARCSHFAAQPEFVPKDGNGLNPLLQNYWMVIHPPTLFLGFASTLVPFSFCIAGLWLKKYRDWVRPALPWALFSGAILGLGILMGGYWAYETLNFGGYWNWDPVENAVYVPWLILIASIHTMITYKNSETALKGIHHPGDCRICPDTLFNIPDTKRCFRRCFCAFIYRSWSFRSTCLFIYSFLLLWQ